MKFLLVIAHDDTFRPTPKLLAGIREWIAEAGKSGLRVHGNPLVPADQARTVRIRDGEAKVSAGTFSRSREQICAYELIECDGIELAVEAAKSHPMAAAATIEVRPVWEDLARG